MFLLGVLYSSGMSAINIFDWRHQTNVRLWVYIYGFVFNYLLQKKLTRKSLCVLIF